MPRGLATVGYQRPDSQPTTAVAASGSEFSVWTTENTIMRNGPGSAVC